MRKKSNKKPSLATTILLILTLILNIPIFPLPLHAQEPITPIPIVNKLNLHFSVSDICIPFFDLPIRFIRTYNSSENDSLSALGYGWIHSYNLTLEEKDRDLIIFKNGAGKRYGFTKRLDGSYITPIGIKAELTKEDEGGYTLTFKNRTRYFFNSNGVLTKISTRNNNVLRFTYAENNNLANITTSSGVKLDLVYDNQNRLIQIKGLNRTPQYLYDDNSNLTKVINFLGDTTEYSYDKQRRLISIKDPLDRLTQFTYDQNGNLTSTIDPKGNKTTYEFIASGYNLTEDKKPLYFPNILTTTDPQGNKTQTTYNDLGNTLSFTDPKGNKTFYDYDKFGNLTKIINPLNAVTEFVYDEDSNLISVTDPLRNQAQLLYDGNNRLIEITDPNNNKTEISYDNNGNPTQIKDSLSGITTLAYNLNGTLKTYHDQNKIPTTFTYDKFGNLLTTTDSKGNAVTYEYNELDFITKIIDQNNQEKQINYNLKDRQIKIIYPNDIEYLYTYDKAGNLISAQGKEGIVSFKYNEFNQPIEVTDTNNQLIRYEYDSLGRKTKLIDTTGATTLYNYDELNNLISITQPDNKIIKFEYGALKRRTAIIYPNNIKTTYRYDKAGHALEIKTQNTITNEIISQIKYSYDSLGNCVSKEDLTGETTYKYDALSRLIKVTKPNNETITYTYDGVGNRLSQAINNIKEQYTYNELNQLLRHNTVTYEYDKNGNLITKTENNQKTQYVYNPSNLLEKVILPNQEKTIFGYDPLERRTLKTTPKDIIKYAYDIEDAFIELDSQNKPITRYIHGPGIDDILSSQNLINNEQSYFTHDNLGSINTILDQKGNIKDTLTYGPFGELTPTVQKQPTTSYLFTGRQYDPETNLYYYRNRYYNPDIGRFTTQDPIGLLGGANLYAYCGNNPVNWVDPLGLWSIGNEEGKFMLRMFEEIGNEAFRFQWRIGDQLYHIADSAKWGAHFATQSVHYYWNRTVSQQSGTWVVTYYSLAGRTGGALMVIALITASGWGGWEIGSWIADLPVPNLVEAPNWDVTFGNAFVPYLTELLQYIEYQTKDPFGGNNRNPGAGLPEPSVNTLIVSGILFLLFNRKNKCKRRS